MTNYVTTFAATENPLSESGKWKRGLTDGLDWNNFRSTGGNAIGTAFSPTLYDDNIACLSNFSANQYIEGVVFRAGGYAPSIVHEIELLLRFDITAHNARGYELLVNSGGAAQIVRWNGAQGDFTVLSPTGPGISSVNNGDKFRFVAMGTKLTAFKNDVPFYTVTDAGAGSISTGSPGIGTFSRGGGGATLASMGWASIEANDLGAKAFYTTTFPTDENPINESGKWQRGLTEGLDWNNPRTIAGNATGAVAMTVQRYADDIAHIKTSFLPYSPNQSAKATVYRAAGYQGNGGGHEIELLLRFSITANDAHGYEILWGLGGYIAVVRWEGGLGSYTALYDPGAGSIPPPQDGDTLEATIVGNIIQVYRNGTIISAATTDITAFGGAVWTSGQPGMGFWPVDGAIPANLGWKDFTAGDIVAPSWVSSLAIGQWYQIPNTNLASVDPSPPVNDGGSEGPPAKTNDWTSFVFDYRNSTFYSVCNGGHDGYGGNEVDGLMLETETPHWVQHLAPTLNDPKCVTYYPDGRPTSRHTYYNVTLNEFDNKIMFFGGSWFCQTGTPWLQTFDSWNIWGDYDPAGSHPNVDYGGYEWICVADPTTGDIYATVGRQSRRWNRATNTFTTNINPTGVSPPWGDYVCAAWDTTRGRYLCLGGVNADHHVYTKATNSWSLATFTGAPGGFTTQGQSGLVYAAGIDKYLIRGQPSGGTIQQIDPVTFAVSNYATTGGGSVPASGQPGNQFPTGPMNKFAYVPNLGGCIYYPVYGQNAWFLKTNVVTTTGGSSGGGGGNANGILAGTVDSSLLDRHTLTNNKVSLFSGSTANPPLLTVSPTQDFGTYTFRYAFPSTTGGDYIVAVTRNNGTSYNTQANVTINGNITQNFAALSTLLVGPSRAITHPNNAIGVAAAGQVIAIDAGTYTNVQGVWGQANLTFRGIGGKAHMVAANPITNLKATWVLQGADNRVEDIEFSQAAVPDFNGCGIRIEGNGLAISCCYFHDNEGGILGNDNVGFQLLEYSEFDTNGNCNDPAHCSHHVYYGHNTRTIAQFNYFHDAFQGHLFKARSQEIRVLYNRIMDLNTGASSYVVDCSNGGLSYIIGNTMQKGPNTDNSGTVIAYGLEGLNNPSTQLYVINNTIVNDVGSNLVRFVQVTAGSANAIIQNNLFVSATATTIATGPNTQTSNILTTTPNFVDRANYNYRPTINTPGLNTGTAPGVGSGLDMTPVFEYVSPLNQQVRPVSGALDLGAFEFTGIVPSNFVAAWLKA